MSRHRKQSPSEVIQNAADNTSPQYTVYDTNGSINTNVGQAYDDMLDSYSGVVRASSRSRMGFDPANMGDGISGRYGLTTEGYEAWRPGEKSRFDDQKQTMLASDICCREHGLIRNVIDLMADFGSQGIRLVHPNKRIERFYQNWFLKVQGEERSERFLNNFYRLGNTPKAVKKSWILLMNYLQKFMQ